MISRSAVFCLTLCIAVNLFAGLELPDVIGDNMVLQRELPVRIWGTAAAGEKVSVSINGKSANAVADEKGKWLVKLPAMKAGGPYEMVVRGKAETVTLKNVMIGEVWLASGQSNMNFAVQGKRGGVVNAKQVITESTQPSLRLFQMPNGRDRMTGPALKKWQPCSPESVKDYSAVAYYFGRKLQQDLNIPVGIIHGSQGGSSIEPWLAPNGQLFKKVFQPIVPFSVRGAIWYQGENNVASVDKQDYSELMNKLVSSWRKIWHEGTFPFYFVMIAPYCGYGKKLPPFWERQQKAWSSIPNCGMAVINDISPPTNLHPHQKKRVGERLALWALARTYARKDIVFSGPLYKSMKVEGTKIRVRFDYDDGLKSGDDDKLIWFEIAGADQAFVPADAQIDKSTVLVSSPNVKQPVAVRYCWNSQAVGNLVNRAGLPAVPFRTDDWDLKLNEKPTPKTIDIKRVKEKVAGPDSVPDLLKDTVPQVVSRGGRQYGAVKLSVSADSVVAEINVVEKNDIQKSSVDLYVSLPKTKTVNQVVFKPSGGDKLSYEIYRMGKRQPQTKIPCKLIRKADGYTILALIPCRVFSLAPEATTFRFDTAIFSSPAKNYQPQFVPLFGSVGGFKNNSRFATVNVK